MEFPKKTQYYKIRFLFIITLRIAMDRDLAKSIKNNQLIKRISFSTIEEL